MGTTQRGESHTYTLQGVEGTVYPHRYAGPLRDRRGRGGARARSPRPGRAGRPADLRARPRPGADRVRAPIGPGPSGQAVDRAPEQVRSVPRRGSDAILAKLRERLRGLVPPDDVIVGAAVAAADPVRVRREDGTTETVLEDQPPELDPLRARIAQVLKREGDVLRAGNLLLRRTCSAARPRISSPSERDRRAEEVIERFQWITAGHVVHESVPGAGAARQRRGPVPDDLGAGRTSTASTLSTSNVRMIGTEMIQMLVRLGLVEATTSLIAGVFKSTMVGYAAGGRRAGGLAGLPDSHLGRDLLRVLPPRPDLGRRRDAGGARSASST